MHHNRSQLQKSKPFFYSHDLKKAKERRKHTNIAYGISDFNRSITKMQGENNTNSNALGGTNVPSSIASSGGIQMKSSLSSLPLEMLVFFGYHYTPFFFIISICLFTYKCKFLFNSSLFSLVWWLTSCFVAIQFYYPSKFLGWELTTIFVYLFIDYVRLAMSKLNT